MTVPFPAQQPGPPAAWYTDPSGHYEYRYWDGGAWTAHVSRHGVAEVDPNTPGLAGGTAATAGSQPRATAPTEASEHAGFFGRIFAEHREEHAERAEVEELVRRAASGDREAVARLQDTVARVSEGWLERHRYPLFAVAVRTAIGDDVLSADDAGMLEALTHILHTDVDTLHDRDPAAFEELVIGQVNNGVLPVVDHPSVLVESGETVHGEFAVALLKSVPVHEFRGGSSGFSVPLGKGVRYRVGAVRGHSEVVGTQLVAEDAGTLAVTSTRTVFSGQHKTLEFPHGRLLALQQYADGLRFNLSGRQTASTFRFLAGSSPSIAAALVTAARQRGQ